MRLRPILRPIISSPLRGLFGPTLAPEGAILHFDADLDPYTEQTGGPHAFNHAVLSPQYQRNADGSYTDVGAKPAVDTIGGEKWLRSCGAVTNMLTNSVFAGAVSGTPGVAPTGWGVGGTGGQQIVNDSPLTITAAAARQFYFFDIAALANNTYICAVDITILEGTASSLLELFLVTGHAAGSTLTLFMDGVQVSFGTVMPAGSYRAEIRLVIGNTGSTCRFRFGVGCNGNATGSVTISNPQLTATAYPVPYVPTTIAGPVTQPASNATVTNGMWFSLPDGSPLWQALTGSPLTLATRVRMGAGSGDLPNGAAGQIIRANESGTQQQFFDVSGEGESRIVRSYDGTSYLTTISTWPRNSIIRRITQVNTAGTQFRVGYMIEGTHTTIQWSAWANYDGSFNPSTLYRLMLGYNNAYPMWFNKITAWPLQVSDAELLEAWA